VPLADLGKWLDAISVQAVIVGGVAAAFLGRPRFTQDIDALAMIPTEEWGAALAAAPRFGIVARIDDALSFAQEARVLLLRHAQSAVDIDLILGGLPFERSVVDHGITYVVAGATLRLPRVEDLLVMKAVAHRPRDLQDVDALLAAHPEADLISVRRWVREFSLATAMSEMLDDFDKAVARRGGADPGKDT
jgi:hypothetical protein